MSNRRAVTAQRVPEGRDHAPYGPPRVEVGGEGAVGALAVLVGTAVVLAALGARISRLRWPRQTPTRIRPGRSLALTVAWWVFLTSLGWAAGIAVAWVTRSGSLGLVDWFAAHRLEGLTWTMARATWLGSGAVVVPVAVTAGLVWRWRRGTWWALTLLVVGYLGSATSYNLVKYLVARARPAADLALGTASGASFPSGHSANAAAVFLGLAIVVRAARGRSPLATWAGAGAGALIAVVAISRVYLAVHWVTDVIAGVLLGALWVVGLALMLAGSEESWRGDSNP